MGINPLVGAWQLVSFAVRDDRGAVTYPFGQEVSGLIIYTPDGAMAVQFGRVDRVPLAGEDWWDATPSAIGAVARDFFAYAGTYTYQDREVVHRVTVSLMPNWVGRTQVRSVSRDGDRLVLSAPPMAVSGRQQVATLTWQRVSSA